MKKRTVVIISTNHC